MKVLIVEDDELFSGRLEMLVEKLGYQLAGVAANSEDALRIARETPPDLLLLDIHIQGEYDGIELAGLIQKDHPVPLIFITSMEDNSSFQRAARTRPVQFLIKPVTDMQLQRSIELAIRSLAHPEASSSGAADWEEDLVFSGYLFIKVRQKLEKVAIPNILFAAADGRYCQIFTPEKKYLVRMPLQELAQKLPSPPFLPTHRSYLLNIKAIDSIDLQDNSIQVRNHTIPLSKRLKDDFLKKMDWI
jgi:DNA-binding LytR/AlgR family response regulator